MKRATLLVLLACSSVVHADDDAASRLVGDTLAAQVAHAKLAGEWRVGPLYWDSGLKHTTAEARLIFGPDPADTLADPAYLAADRFQIDLGPPPRLLAQPDPDHLRAAVRNSAQVVIALGLARAKLKTLPRYEGWRHEGWRYETTIYVGPNGHIHIGFDPPHVTDNDISIEIDPAARTIISVRLGAA